MFYYSQWQRIPQETKGKIAEKFGLNKTLPTHVEANVVVQDGYAVHDVEHAINLASLQAFTGSDSTNYEELMALTVEMINNPVVRPVIIYANPPVEMEEAKLVTLVFSDKTEIAEETPIKDEIKVETTPKTPKTNAKAKKSTKK